MQANMLANAPLGCATASSEPLRNSHVLPAVETAAFKFYSTIYVMHLVRSLAHKPALRLMFSTPLSGQLYLRDTEQL